MLLPQQKLSKDELGGSIHPLFQKKNLRLSKKTSRWQVRNMYYACHIMPRESPWRRMILISKKLPGFKKQFGKKGRGERTGLLIFITLMPLGKLSFVELN